MLIRVAIAKALGGVCLDSGRETFPGLAISSRSGPNGEWQARQGSCVSPLQRRETCGKWLLPAVEFVGSGYERAVRTVGLCRENPEKARRSRLFRLTRQRLSGEKIGQDLSLIGWPDEALLQSLVREGKAVGIETEQVEQCRLEVTNAD